MPGSGRSSSAGRRSGCCSSGRRCRSPRAGRAGQRSGRPRRAPSRSPPGRRSAAVGGGAIMGGGGHTPAQDAGPADARRRLAIVLGLTAAFMVAEVVGGLLAGSLALLADAGHMLSDSLSLGLALLAAWAAQRPATSQRTFGYRRGGGVSGAARG